MTNPDFSKGLLPAIVQDQSTGAVLMLAYMNSEAWEKTLESKRVTFLSRSRNRLWTKGEESGNFLHLQSWKTDCDGDTILLQVKPTGPVCHTGTATCFGDPVLSDYSFLHTLQQILEQRKTMAPSESYVAQLYAEGDLRIAQKVGEEGVEVALEGMRKEDGRLLNESADLIFHLMILLSHRGFQVSDVIRILAERNSPKSE